MISDLYESRHVCLQYFRQLTENKIKATGQC